MATFVPSGMAFDGFYNNKINSKFKIIFKVITLKLPDIFAPARIPVTEGKKTPNTCWNVSPSSNFGPKFSLITFPK
jgi:hypothetical protein